MINCAWERGDSALLLFKKMNQDRIILNINPKAQVLSTQGAKIVFVIPEICPKNCGLPRRNSKADMVDIPTMKETHNDLWEALGGEKWKPRKTTIKRGWVRYGCPHSLSYENLNFKRRLERNNKWKEELKRQADEIGFTIPHYGWSIYFYFPVPKRFSNKKKKAMHGQLHQAKRGDLDNLMKNFGDALLLEDEKIAQLSGHGKFWVNQESGYIEILLNQPVYNPFSVNFITT